MKRRAVWPSFEGGELESQARGCVGAALGSSRRGRRRHLGRLHGVSSPVCSDHVLTTLRLRDLRAVWLRANGPGKSICIALAGRGCRCAARVYLSYYVVLLR